MREETALWLNPMWDEADKRGMNDLRGLMMQASMPAAEADAPVGDILAELPVSNASHLAIDWIRFGQLLREALGWCDYPALPDDE